MQMIIHNLQEMDALGIKIGNLAWEGMFITLNGDLGAGKTTLTKSIGKALGIKKVINSPTFTILKIYYGRMPLYHIDAYRLEGIHQDLGFEEIYQDDGVCVVEWSQYIQDLPSERLNIHIQINDDDTRLLTIEGNGKKYKEMEMCLC